VKDVHALDSSEFLPFFPDFIVPVWGVKRTERSCNYRLTVGVILNFRNVPGKYPGRAEGD